jgi:hypothetical protein
MAMVERDDRLRPIARGEDDVGGVCDTDSPIRLVGETGLTTAKT